MNEINEIILSINKVEEDEQKVNAINENEKNYTISDELNERLKLLKEKLSKRSYKKVIKDIETYNLIKKYRHSPCGYKILVIYIQAKLKVIENKIFKYHLSQNENSKQKTQIAHCLSYANNIPIDLRILVDEVSVFCKYDNKYYYNIYKKNYRIEIFEDLIRCHFDYLYIMSLFHYKIGNIMDSISYLALFLSLYKESRLFILSSHSLFKIEKSFILLSKIYISNEDYSNALLVLNEAIKVCFKQILFQVQEIYYGVYVGEKKDLIVKEKTDLLLLKDSRIKRAILNIIIIFLYQGVCNEHLSNIKKATAFYKQCEWFTRIFLEKNNDILYKLFYKLKKNGIEICNLIDFFNEKIEEYEIKFRNKKKEDNNDDKKNKKYAMKKEKIFSKSKFNGLIKKLQGLKIKEIDTVNKFEQNKNIKTLNSKREANDKNLYLSNIRLLEAYLRNDFKDIVNDMDKINMFDFDYRTRTVVQKTLNKYFFEKNQKLIRDKNKSLFYRPYKKSVTIRNGFKDENEEVNKCLSNRDYTIFDSISDLKNNQNKIKKKININLSKFNLSKNNSLKLLPTKKGNGNNVSKDKNRSNVKLRLSNKEILNSPKNRRLHYSSSTSFFLNSSRLLRSNQRSPSQSREIKKDNNKSKEKEKESINLKEKYKSISLTKINKSSKYKLIHPENQKLNEFFNFKYLKKRDYIKKLTDRELLFQKSILKSKNTPRLSFQSFNKALVQKSADNTFKRIESLVSNRLSSNDWRDNLSDDEYREYLINNRLEKTLISSLDNKALRNYKMNLKRIEKIEDEKEIMEDASKYDKRLINIDNNNKNTLKDLNEKLNKIYENELKRNNEMKEHRREINKNIFKKFHRNKSTLNKSSMKDSLNLKLGSSSSYSNLTRVSINKYRYHF